MSVTRLGSTLSILAVLGACRGRPTATPDANGRVVIHARSADALGVVRAQLVEAASKRAVLVELHDGTRSVSLELPTTRALDDATSVVVLRIDAVGRYGANVVTDTAALERAARRDAANGSIVLLRVADDIAIHQITAVTDTLTRAGVAHVVLGFVPPGLPPPEDGWEGCPFPADSRESHGRAVLSIDWDDQGRPGVVRIVESTGHGFGGAALLCTLWQRSNTSRCSGKPPCTQTLGVRFER